MPGTASSQGVEESGQIFLTFPAWKHDSYLKWNARQKATFIKLYLWIYMSQIFV